MVLAFTLPVSAQSMLDDGNVWTYVVRGNNPSIANNPVVEASAMKYYINGEREIDGKKYKDIWVQSAAIGEPNASGSTTALDYDKVTFYEPVYYSSAREENGKVYVRIDELKRVVSYLKYSYDWFEDYSARCWIEECGDECVIYDFNTEQPVHTTNTFILPNIGCSRYLLYFYENYPTDGIMRGTSLNLFYRNGKVEYKSKDYFPDPFFPDETLGNIGVPKTLTDKDATTYNISGQRLSQPQTGLNIVGGKKVLVR